MLLERLAGHDFWNSLRDLNRLEQEFSRHRMNFENSSEFPPINVWIADHGAILRTEIPGTDPEQIDITLVNDTVTIRGSREADAVGEYKSCHRKERDCGQFVRSLQLPFAVEGDAVTARYENGVLEVTLPRAEADKPKKINIKAD